MEPKYNQFTDVVAALNELDERANILDRHQQALALVILYAKRLEEFQYPEKDFPKPHPIWKKVEDLLKEVQSND